MKTILSLPSHSLTQYSATIKKCKEPEWDFDKSECFYRLGEDYGTLAEVDPFPASAHNIAQVGITLQQMPIQVPVEVYVLQYELKTRTNGWTDQQFRGWNGKGYDSEMSIIALSGKRTPIPYNMTRYITAHEYGHAVENFISFKTQNENLRVEYGKMRGVDLDSYYGGGKWTDSPGEIFADDFRIAIAGVDQDFWPHKAAHPLDEQEKLTNWWHEKLNELNEIIEYVQ